MNTASNPEIEKIAKLLTNISINYNFDETGTYVGFVVPDSQGGPVPITITTTHNYWVALSTMALMQNSCVDDQALSLFYKNLLRENQNTKLGRFYINDANHVEFAIDLKLADINEEMLNQAIDLIIFNVEDRLPLLVEPYLSYFFNNS